VVDDPESWRWIWMAVAAAFLVGEMATPATFFLLPFGVGAVIACAAAFAGAGVGLQWLLFVLVSGAVSAMFIPLRRRLDREEPVDGIGARRLLNQEAVVVSAVDPGVDGVGRVQVGREVWRAESANRVGIPEGAVVTIVDVRGTGVIVRVAQSPTGGPVP
jgi:membrane protein implicated in regulation of membrane protease activity